jgi:hypothetical protein
MKNRKNHIFPVYRFNETTVSYPISYELGQTELRLSSSGIILAKRPFTLSKRGFFSFKKIQRNPSQPFAEG